jgi:hypothetical protein
MRPEAAGFSNNSVTIYQSIRRPENWKNRLEHRYDRLQGGWGGSFYGGVTTSF